MAFEELLTALDESLGMERAFAGCKALDRAILSLRSHDRWHLRLLAERKISLEDFMREARETRLLEVT